MIYVFKNNENMKNVDNSWYIIAHICMRNNNYIIITYIIIIIITRDILLRIYVCAIIILENTSWQIILCNSVVNQLYTCLKCNKSIKNLNSSCVNATNMVPEIDVRPISQNYSWQFFFLILE